MRPVIIVFSLATLVSACGATAKNNRPVSTDGTNAATTAPTVAVPASATDAQEPSATEEPRATAAGSPAPSGAAGTVEDAKQRLAEFSKPGADTAKLTQALKPSADDLKAIFDQSVLAAMREHVDKMYASMGKGVEMKDAPDVLCFSSDDIKSWTANAQRDMPGGYKRVGPKLKPGLTLCRFKAGGVSYDSLVSVGGKWVFVPKPFRAIK